MKPICTFCHVDDHIRINCPALKPRRKACFICDKTDHLRAACPLAPWNANCKRARPVASTTSTPIRKEIDESPPKTQPRVDMAASIVTSSDETMDHETIYDENIIIPQEILETQEDMADETPLSSDESNHDIPNSFLNDIGMCDNHMAVLDEELPEGAPSTPLSPPSQSSNTDTNRRTKRSASLSPSVRKSVSKLRQQERQRHSTSSSQELITRSGRVSKPSGSLQHYLRI
ncbi:hypothetical protein A0J61_10067 [Choanephora cucurbitarum]|uniref:CCHC-type domain-containing protein n=1 Tax=Choanephora cucurbitarum TaxID=101091 RepID=A0A1C7MYJ7_9FUNG|nr:hypothetical protein A0J61_10067 [Choanephora cucurbitarum]